MAQTREQVVRSRLLEPLNAYTLQDHWHSFKDRRLDGRRAREIVISLGGKTCIGFRFKGLDGVKMAANSADSHIFPITTSGGVIGQVRMLDVVGPKITYMAEQPEVTAELQQMLGLGLDGSHLNTFLDVEFRPLSAAAGARLSGNRRSPLGVSAIADCIDQFRTTTIKPDAILPAFVFHDEIPVLNGQA